MNWLKIVNWLKPILMKLLRTAIDQLVQEAVETATTELHREIDETFPDEKSRETLKSGVNMLSSRVVTKLQEKF